MRFLPILAAYQSWSGLENSCTTHMCFNLYKCVFLVLLRNVLHTYFGEKFSGKGKGEDPSRYCVVI